jgi:hypothetical protein
MPHRQPPASGTSASGTRSADRSDRPGLAWSGYRAPSGRSSVAGHRSPRKPAATRDREPTRRADARLDPVASASSSPRLPIPLLEPRAKEEGEKPRAFNRIGTRPPGRWVTPAEQDAGPAVKTSDPRLSPRDAQCAVGGIRAWGENPGRRASSPTTVLPFAALAYPDRKKFARTPPHELVDPPPRRHRARLPPTMTAPRITEPVRDPSKRGRLERQTLAPANAGR